MKNQTAQTPFTIRAEKKQDGSGELMIYGIIDDFESWYSDDVVTPKAVDAALKDLADVSTLNVRINSFGGSVFAGNAIIAMLNRFQAEKNVYIEGLAASMAAVIACGTNGKVYMTENSLMMTHPASSVAVGNAKDMRDEAELLDKVDAIIRNIFSKRFKGSDEQFGELMDYNRDKWLTADEALEFGLIDEIEESVSIAACLETLLVNGGKLSAVAQGDDIFKLLAKGGKPTMQEPEKNGAGGTPEDATKTDAAKAEATKAVTDEQDASKSVSDAVTFDPIAIVSDWIKDKLGEETTPETVIALAEYGKAYQADLIADAIKAGIQAQGNDFPADSMKSAFAKMSPDELKDIAKAYKKSAEALLPTGRKSSIEDAAANTNEDVEAFRF